MARAVEDFNGIAKALRKIDPSSGYKPPDSIGFAKAVMQTWQDHDCYDIDGSDLQDMAEQFHMIRRVKFDPEIHSDPEGDAEPGDDWWVSNF